MSWWTAVFPERDAGAVATIAGMFALATLVLVIGSVGIVPMHVIAGGVLLFWSVARLAVVARRIEESDVTVRRSRLGVAVALAISLALNSLGLLLVAYDRLSSSTFWAGIGVMVCIPALVACWIEVRTARRPPGEIRIPSVPSIPKIPNVAVVVALPSRTPSLEVGPAPEDDPRVDDEYLAFRSSLLNGAADRPRWYHVTEPVRAVVLEVGGEDSVSLLAAYPDGRLRLVLTSGQAFSGSCRGLPEDVGFAAEHLVEIAGTLRGTLKRELSPRLPEPGHVRVALMTRRRTFADYAGTAALGDGQETLLATWLAGSQLFETLARALWPSMDARPEPARTEEPAARPEPIETTTSSARG